MEMAKTLQIRNVPEELHARIKARAAAEGLSISDYLLQEITKVAERPSMREVLERAAARPGFDVDTKDIVAAIREARGD
jgi:plasmid stability protein